MLLAKSSGGSMSMTFSPTHRSFRMTDLEMVQQNGYALEYVKEQTPEICLAAVQKNGWAI